LTRRRANQFLLATILALYGAITVGGPALHAVPGFGHSSTRSTSDDGNLPARADQESAAVHDCPICHFHAQGQIVADPDTFPCLEIVRIRACADPPISPTVAIERSSVPRAPPLA
jgi:hypothetical protein